MVTIIALKPTEIKLNKTKFILKQLTLYATMGQLKQTFVFSKFAGMISTRII